MLTIRRALPTDAKALAEIAESTFRATFEAFNAPEHMAAHCAQCYGEALQGAEIRDPAITTLLCVRGDELIGFAQLRRGGAPDCVLADAPGEIQRLYVDASWHGKGAARQLMEACLDELSSRRCDVAWLGVWEHNHKAIAFYRKHGFAPQGEQIFWLASDPQRDLVMVRPLSTTR